MIACAPRYVKEESGGSQRWGHGKCFTLTSDLRHSATWDPCQGRPKNRAHEQWGYCQAGISALLTSDDSSDTSQQEDTSTVALIGAPGPYTWRGTVFALTVDGDFLTRDKTHYHTPVRASQAAPVDKYSYLGMALAAGNFLPPHSACGKRSVYAAGAPRAGDTGKVHLLSTYREGHNGMSTINKENKNLHFIYFWRNTSWARSSIRFKLASHKWAAQKLFWLWRSSG